MKRTIGMLAGLATLGGAAYLGNHLWAQQQFTQPAAQPVAAQPMSRVAVVNLGQIMRNYVKYKNIQAELQDKQGGYKKQYDALNAKLTSYQAEMANAQTLPTRKEQIPLDVKNVQRQVQDLEEQMKNEMGKLSFERTVQTYKEVEQAVQVLARSRNLEMVMHYQDGIGPDAYLPGIFQRRLTNNACMPIYMAPGIDITADVTTMLNARMAQGMAPPAAPAPLQPR